MFKPASSKWYDFGKVRQKLLDEVGYEVVEVISENLSEIRLKGEAPGRMRRRLLIGSLAVASGLAAVIILSLARNTPRETNNDQNLKRKLERLRSIPYTTMTPQKVSGPSGVTVYDSLRSWRGYQIFCSAISPEVYLMDMYGKMVHRWYYPEKRKRHWVWAPALMLPNGDVIVVSRMRDIKRLDWNSNLIWKVDAIAHHEASLAPDSTIYTIVRDIKNYRGLQVRFAAILHLTLDGKEIGRWSTYDHLDEIKQAFDTRSFLDNLIDSLSGRGGIDSFKATVPGKLEVYKRSGKNVYDYFHMNTVTVLPENALAKDRRFKPGNLLICFRNVNQIAILDKDTREILWVWGEGELQWPHHPTMLANGHILIFDNGPVRGYSRVIELDPVTYEIVWQYVGDPPESFYSYEKGSAQRLANGNTLICEGDRGRAFEVTPDGEIVWEWINPRKQRMHRVQIYRMIRLSPEVVEPLLRQGHTIQGS